MIALGSIGAILFSAIIFPFFVKYIARKTFLLAAGLLIFIDGIFLSNFHKALEDNWIEQYLWIPQLGLSLDVRIDTLAYIMSISALSIGAIVMIYCYYYFKKTKKPIASLGAQLLAFAGAMLGLLVSDNLILFFIFWEITTILSYLLIGYESQQFLARKAAMKALIVTTAGGLIMLAGLLFLGHAGNTFSMRLLLSSKLDGSYVLIAAWCLSIGAITKSALFPTHFWLPGAMQAPTPVSAYLHAAAMVNGGVYIIQRTNSIFCEIPGWQISLSLLGIYTMIFAGYQALKQHDMKLILAYSTISQLGFLGAIGTLNTKQSFSAFITIFISHSLFKATLFMWVGIVDNTFGTRDLRYIKGLKDNNIYFYAIALINALSMASIFPLLGYIAKEEGILAFIENKDGYVLYFFMLLLIFGSMLTCAYSFRFIYGISGGLSIGYIKNRNIPSNIQMPLIFLTAFSLILTVFPSILNIFKDNHNHINSFNNILTKPIIVTLCAYLGGLALFFSHNYIQRIQQKYALPISATSIYQKIVKSIENLANYVTAITQQGSLPFYLSIILIVASLFPAICFFLADNINHQSIFHGIIIHWENSGIEFIISGAIIASAFLTIFAGKRFSAIIFASLTGYSLALLFSTYGAPDIALTQVVVETVSLIAFVLALRLLPADLWNTMQRGRVKTRVLIAIIFSVAMGIYTIISLSSRSVNPISYNFFKMAYEQGGGLNTVNVTLVDLRGWDTFGEISVLVAAATGVASLIFVENRDISFKRVEEAKKGSIDKTAEFMFGNSKIIRKLAKQFNGQEYQNWLPAAKTLSPERRSLIFEITIRLIFHTLIIFSLFLLLSGHDAPGGGFVGGLFAGVACAIRYLAGGRYELTEAIPIPTGYFLGVGLIMSATIVIGPIVLGDPAFSNYIYEWTLPVLGKLKFISVTIFDCGVYLIVFGLVLDVLRSLGSEIDSHAQDENVATNYETVIKKDLRYK